MARLARFAEGTTVPVEKSRAEVERLLRRHGATGFVIGWEKDRATVVFEIPVKRPSLASVGGPSKPPPVIRRVRFDVPAPLPSEYRTTEKWEQEERRRWRALLLIVKAKLELVAAGDADFDTEFLAYLVIGGKTVGQAMIPELDAATVANRMPPLLGSG